MASPYVEIVRRLPRPSANHIAAFAEFVAGAHSWYKHLPLHPDVPFVFFVDPNAGRQVVHTRAGETAVLEVTDDDPRFHYTWKTTKVQLEQFGHLAYDANYGTSISRPSADGAPQVARPRPQVLSEEGDWIRVDGELLVAGTALLNAAVYERADPMLWERNAQYNGLREFEKAHGPLEQFIEHGHEALREELLARMRAAMERFMDAVYGGPA